MHPPATGGYLYFLCSVVILGISVLLIVVYLVVAIRNRKKRPKDTEITRIRRNWLHSWRMFIGFQVFLILFLGIQGFFIEQSPEESTTLMRAIGSSFGTLLGLTLCYFLAYRKSGTKFLTYFLVISIKGGVGEILSSGRAESNPSELVSLMVFLSIFLWFQIASWRLRRLNKQMQKVDGFASKFQLLGQ